MFYKFLISAAQYIFLYNIIFILNNFISYNFLIL